MKITLHGRGVVFLTALMMILGASAPASAADPIGPQLRARLEKARSELGELKSWQEEAFLNEVLASSGRFVKDYVSKGNVVTRVDVDFDAIKRYLSFHTDQVFRNGRTTILAVRATESCAPCVGAVPFVREDLRNRLERRGFEVVMLNAQESRRDLAEVLSQKNAVGWVLADIKNVEDPDHAGDFKNELLLEFRFPGTVVSRVQKQMETLPKESIEVSLSRMALDGITEMGNLVRQARIGSLEAEGSEGIEISVQGITSYSQMLELKRSLQAHFQSAARVVEKRIQRGNVAIAVIGDVKPGEVSKALQGIQHSQLNFKVMNSRDQVLNVSATPKG